MIIDSEMHVPVPSEDADEPNDAEQDAVAAEGFDPDLSDELAPDSIDQLDKGD